MESLLVGLHIAQYIVDIDDIVTDIQHYKEIILKGIH